MMNEMVSVIIPCFNGGDYIRECINSVQNQSYNEVEIIVIDNNSSDNSKEIILEMASLDNRIIYLFCFTPGASHARNLGIKHAKGRYIAFLDCDDTWESNKLSFQINFMKFTRSNLCCSSYYIIDSQSKITGQFFIKKPLLAKFDLMKTCSIGCLTVLIDIDTYDRELLPLFPHLPKEDYAYWFDLMVFFNQPFVVVKSKLASYRVHSQGISNNKFREIRHQWNVYRRHLGLGVSKSLFYIFTYIYFGIRKTFF